MCKYWHSKRCHMGNECNFAHSSEELRSAPSLLNTKLCFQFHGWYGCVYDIRWVEVLDSVVVPDIYLLSKMLKSHPNWRLHLCLGDVDIWPLPWGCFFSWARLEVSVSFISSSPKVSPAHSPCSLMVYWQKPSQLTPLIIPSQRNVVFQPHPSIYLYFVGRVYVNLWYGIKGAPFTNRSPGSLPRVSAWRVQHATSPTERKSFSQCQLKQELRWGDAPGRLAWKLQLWRSRCRWDRWDRWEVDG